MIGDEEKREAGTSWVWKRKKDRVGAGAFKDGILFAVGGDGDDSRGTREVERRGAARCGNAGTAGAGSNRSGWARSKGSGESLLDAEQATRNCDGGGG